MLFKFYFKRIRIVKRIAAAGGPYQYEYDEEQTAFSKAQYFTTLEKARTYADKHVEKPLVWEELGPHHIAASNDLEFIICLEDSDLDPEEPLQVPAESEFRHNGWNPD
jgi:hypothetical protein